MIYFYAYDFCYYDFYDYILLYNSKLKFWSCVVRWAILKIICSL